jgi:hypothetical protein
MEPVGHFSSADSCSGVLACIAKPSGCRGRWLSAQSGARSSNN